MHERKVIIRGRTFLYSQKAPFVKSGESVYGALEYDEAEDKVRCHECGEWFRSVAGHAAKKHGIDKRTYKHHHGLRQRSALIAEGLREKYLASGRNPATLSARVGRGAELHKFSIARRGQIKSGAAERANENGRCHAQLLEQLARLTDRLSRIPTTAELEEHGLSVNSICARFNVTKMSSVYSLMGLHARKPGTERKYSDVVLIEMLRDFAAKYGRTPASTDIRRGLLPATIATRFGSFSKAMRAASLKPRNSGRPPASAELPKELPAGEPVLESK